MQYLVAQAISFVEERVLVEEGKEARPLRGPFLARLELIGRLRVRGCPEEQQLGTAPPTGQPSHSTYNTTTSQPQVSNSSPGGGAVPAGLTPVLEGALCLQV